MKQNIFLVVWVLICTLTAGAQSCASGNCSCPSCSVTEAQDQAVPHPVPVVTVPDPHDHAGHLHDDHDHEALEEDSHNPIEAPHEDHDGHNHEEHNESPHSAVVIPEEKTGHAGIEIHEATGAVLDQTALFPAEIKLNRDRAAAVSPRYPSIVRAVHAEIGDVVKKGDVLASLENRETLAGYTVEAPLDGVIIAKDLAVGETAGPDHVLYEVADLSSVWADISIFPSYQHLLRKGMEVTFIAHDGHTAQGRVKYVSPIISHETRTFTARCILVGADEDFTPGAFVRARVVIRTKEVPVAVPLEAIQLLDGEQVVFIETADGFKSVEVEPGLSDGVRVEIKRGLEPGDRYVATGAFTVKAQMVTHGMDPHAGHGH